MSNRTTVEHRWMHNNDPYKNGGGQRDSLTFRGFTMYSYATPIAHKYPHTKGDSGAGGVVILNYRTYSASSSKHQSKIRRAIPATWTTLYIHSDRFGRGYDYVSTPRNVKAALEVMYEDQETLVKELKTARLRSTRAHLWNQIMGKQNDIMKIAKFLKRKPRGLKRFNLDITAISADALAYTDEQDKKRTARWARQSEEQRKRQEARDAELRLTREERIVKWRNGEPTYTHLSSEGVLLRFSKDGRRVQTSRGVEILLKDALFAFKYARMYKEKFKDHPKLAAVHAAQLAMDGVQIGHYTLNGISPEGDLTIGCHFLKYDEMEQLFNKLTEEQKERINDDQNGTVDQP